jgi:beta-fructofuranosidase
VARLTDESLYAGRLLQDHEGAWWLFAFDHVDGDRAFIGSLSDPLPVGWGARGGMDSRRAA